MLTQLEITQIKLNWSQALVTATERVSCVDVLTEAPRVIWHEHRKHGTTHRVTVVGRECIAMVTARPDASKC